MTSSITTISNTSHEIANAKLRGIAVEQTALLVLGMHRSGTSATTRVLSLLGADLPANLMLPKAENNEAGFWESLDTYKLNDRILASAGSSWDDWRQFNPDWERSPVSEVFRREALEILQREFSRSPLFVLKDPRICRLLPFWAKTTKRYGADVKCVIPLRNPLEVAASLKNRDGFSPAKSHMLWLRHVLDAEKATRKLPRVFFAYDDLLDDWRGTMNRVAKRLDMGWPRKAAVAEVEIDRFLDDRHRHHSIDDASLQNHAEVAAWVRAASKALSKLVTNPYAKKPMKRLDAIRAEFNRASDALGAVLLAEELARADAIKEFEKKSGAAASELQQRKVQVDGLQSQVTSQEQEIAKLHAALSDQQADSAKLNASVIEKELSMQQLRAGMSDRDQKIAALEAQLEHEAKNVTKLSEVAENRKQEIAKRLQSEKENERRISELQVMVQKRDAELGNAAKQHEEQSRVLEKLVGDLRESAAEVGKLQKELVEVSVALKEANASISGKEAELETLRTNFKESDQRNQALALELTEQKQVVSRLQRTLDKKNARISELRSVVSDSDEDIRKLRNAVEMRDKELESNQSVLADRVNQITTLEQELNSSKYDLSLARSVGETQKKEMSASRSQLSKSLHQLNVQHQERGYWGKSLQLPPTRCCGRQLKLKDRFKLRRQARMLLANKLFDMSWYVERYPDVILAGNNPLWHWLSVGWQHGFDPNPLFDVKWYVRRYPDVAAAEVNPLLHYLQFGAGEGRDPSRFFLTSWYLARYDDVAQSGINPLVHYFRHGVAENRNPHPLFDAAWYLSKVPEASQSNSTPLVHYLREWKHTAVDPSPIFDTVWYLSRNPDVQRAGVNPWVHFLQHGMRERRNPNAYFDYQWYVDRNPIVSRSGQDALLHFLEQGAKEALDPSPTFNTAWYLAQNPDVSASGLNPLLHFLMFGRHEGRDPIPTDTPAQSENLLEKSIPGDQPVSVSPAVRALQVTSDHINVAHQLIAEGDAGSFSIILPTWNRAATIARSIDSVLAQSYENWELLICDDGSKDDTETLISTQYASQLRSGKIRYLKLEHRGVSSARNAGLRVARGDWVAYLDSDNSWNPHYLLITAASYVRNRHCRTAYAGIHVRDEAAQREFIRAQEFNWGRVLKQNFIDLNIFSHHRGVYDQLGGFDESLTRLVDWDLIVRYTRLYEPAFNKLILANYYVAHALNNITLTQPLKKNEAAVRRKYAADVARFGATPLRLAYVLWDWPALSQTFVLEEIRELLSRGVDVRVYYKVSPDRAAELVPDVVALQVSDADQLAEALEKDERNWIHSHFAYPAVTQLAWPAAEKSGIAFSFMPHAVDIFHHANRERNRIAEVTQSNYCERVMVHGEFHRSFLVEQGVPAGKIIMTPQAVVTDSIRAEVVQIRARQSSDALHVLTIARFIEKKGIEDLIKAVSLLPRGQLQVRIIGYGPLGDSYRELIRENGLESHISLEDGFEGVEALRAVLDWADVFCLPCVEAENGDMDGMPTVFFEAMAAGVPCVSGAVSAIPDFIVDGINGFLVTPHRSDLLAAKLHQIASMPTKALEAIAVTARDYIDNHIDSRHTLDVLLDTCAKPPLDVFMVTYHRDGYGDWKATERAIHSVLDRTTTPMVLTIVDNGSESRILECLREVSRGDSRIRLIELNENRFCGPASDVAISLAKSEYVFYVCSNEGYAARNGWERPCVRFMRNNPDMAMAGHLVSSPAWPDGAGYMAQNWFSHFRNREFATMNPNRSFSHVQGGIWILRRAVYEQEGGFNPMLPQGQMDVEYCYFLESLGYKLGDIDGLVVLSNKTRPGIGAFLDEQVLAVHPVFDSDLHLIDECARGMSSRCNVCNWKGDPARFSDGIGFVCPECGSSPRDRAAFRWLAGSDQHHRNKRLVSSDLGDAVLEQLKGMFEIVESDGDVEVADEIPGTPSRMLGIPPLALLEKGYQNIQEAELPEEPICNICGGNSFGPGPGGRMSAETLLPPRCIHCQSLERHRAFRSAMNMLRSEDWRSKRVLQFSEDRAVDASWFDLHDVSVYGGENSLDLQAIDRDDESYDIVICNHVMEHVADDQAALKELYRVVRPNGFVFLSFPDPLRRQNTNDWGYPDGRQHGHYRVYGRDIYSRMIAVLPNATIYRSLAEDPVTKMKEMFFVFGKNPLEIDRLTARLPNYEHVNLRLARGEV